MLSSYYVYNLFIFYRDGSIRNGEQIDISALFTRTQYRMRDPSTGTCRGNVILHLFIREGKKGSYLCFITGKCFCKGIGTAVNELIDNGEAGMNFLLSDGDTLWAFRKPQLSTHTLFYRYYNNTDGVYSAVASEYPSSSQGDWLAISEDNLVVLTADAAPAVIDVYNYTPPGGDLLVDADFDSGSIGPYTITGYTLDLELSTETLV
ncbi:unnamed protein product, partial [marine sediment metagenome]